MPKLDRYLTGDFLQSFLATLIVLLVVSLGGVLSAKKGCWLRTVPAADNAALWLLDMIRRAAAGLPQAEGTGFLPAGQAAQNHAEPGAASTRMSANTKCVQVMALTRRFIAPPSLAATLPYPPQNCDPREKLRHVPGKTVDKTCPE